MAVVDGIYTKDFPDLGRVLADTDLLIIAVPSDNVTYKRTWGEIKSEAQGRLFAISLNASGEYDFTADNIRAFPSVTIYDSTGNITNYFYNNTTKKITGGTPSEAINVRFI